MSGHKSPRTFQIAVAVSIVGAAIVLGSIALFVITRRRRERASSFKTIEIAQDVSPRPFTAPNTTSPSNMQRHRRNSAPASFVPTSKTQIIQAAQTLPPTSPTDTAGPSTSDLSISPTDREAATYLWNLLLRHQRTLSVQPVAVQPQGGSTGPNTPAREEGDSMQPPAYGM